jgi:hypothetical protein
MEDLHHNQFDDLHIQVGGQLKIDPGDSANYGCRVNNPGVTIKALTMDVSIQFKTLFIWPRTYTKQFLWVVDGPQSGWIEGPGIN